MNILLGLPTFLSNETLRIIRVLNQPLKIPRLLTLHISPNPTILHNFSIGRSDSATNDCLLLQRNIDRKTIMQLKRWKSIQSSCEKDGVPKKCRGCIEDHRQSAEPCAKSAPENCENNNRQQTSNRQESCADLLNHQEYYRSIESSSPIYSDKPVPYNDRQECESMKRDSHKSTVIMCETWTCGKPATERKIYHKCKPKSCAYPKNSDKAIRFPSDTQDCNEEKLEKMTIDKPKRTDQDSKQCSETEPSFSEEICTSKKTPFMKSKMSKPCSVSDTDNEQIKPDPPPPRCQHWSENPPSYCDHCSNKTIRTVKSTVKSSPMIFVPRKEPWKFWMKGSTSSLQDIHEDRGKSTSKNGCDRTDARTTRTTSKSVSEKRIPRRVISSENKSAASLPAFVNRTKRRVVQRFPTLTRNGRCRVEKSEKDFAKPDVSDCNPSMASFKYRLSKCPSIKEMWSIGVNHESSDTDVHSPPKQEAPLSVCEKIERRKSRPREKEGRKRKRFESSGEWTRQRYKIRLKIFQKGNGRLDPCLPRIVELRQPRDGKAQSILSKLFGLAADEGELPPQLKSPPDYCPPKWSVVENKSYPTKMDESRVIRDQNLEKHSCKKR